MKYILILLLVVTASYADYLKKKSLACPSIMLIQKAPINEGDSGLDMTFYAMSNSCMILSKKDKIEAIGYDPRNSKDIYQKIIHKSTGNELLVNRNNIIIEQGGKKNTLYRF